MHGINYGQVMSVLALYAFRQPPADDFDTGRVVRASKRERRNQSAIGKLNGGAETAPTSLTDRCLVVDYYAITGEVKLKPILQFFAQYGLHSQWRTKTPDREC